MDTGSQPLSGIPGNMKRLESKRIVVIGAGAIGPGWGNGKAAAVAYAREGASVLCVDRNHDSAEETRKIIVDDGGIAESYAIDILVSGATDSVMEKITALYGGIDVLHYNVGSSSPGGTLETSDEDWAGIFDLNLTGAMRATRSVLPAMRAQAHGVLVYISSLAAQLNGPYSYVSYETSKAALCRYSSSVAKENAPFGIRANTILPGVIETPHVSNVVAPDTDARVLAEKRAAMVPLGRQGTAWDVANAAVFLSSREADFITGIDLRVDGGMGC